MTFKNFKRPTNDGLQFLYDDEVEAINGYQKVKEQLKGMDLPQELKKEIFDKIEYIVKDEVEHCEILTDLIKKVNERK